MAPEFCFEYIICIVVLLCFQITVVATCKTSHFETRVSLVTTHNYNFYANKKKNLFNIIIFN